MATGGWTAQVDGKLVSLELHFLLLIMYLLLTFCVIINNPYFPGWVFGLTTENVETRSRLQRDSIASSTSSTVESFNSAAKIKVEKLRRELDLLQSKVMEEREK